jgi:hypothetical protein
LVPRQLLFGDDRGQDEREEEDHSQDVAKRKKVGTHFRIRFVKGSCFLVRRLMVTEQHRV